MFRILLYLFNKINKQPNLRVMENIIYPIPPENSDAKVLKPNKTYKAEIIKVTFSLVFFALVYIALVFLAAILAACVSFCGIYLILLKPMFATVMLGLGLIGLGIMVLYFLIKFIFSTQKADRTGFTEIFEKDYPDLFSFIRKVTRETKTKMPKKVYLSSDVNACVFYDSSFLSMFFPVKKNLNIGLGLVNCVNMSEFKAVIAHEFGHFSQHSMKLGSYVYNINKILYNLLFDNESYANTITSWANASGYFLIFARITIFIVQGIQSILRKTYIIVNKTNLGLSRQMEHHADTISAFVAGPNHVVSSLKRTEIGGICYNSLFNYYNQWLSDNLKPDNIYQHHSELIALYAQANEIPMTAGLPNPNDSGSGLNQSHVVIKDQWASHPSLEDRAKYLMKLGINNTKPDKISPWILFGDYESLQKKTSEKIYETVKFKEQIIPLNKALFVEKVNKDFSNRTYNKKYLGFFDGRRMNSFDPDTLVGESVAETTSFSDLINEENCLLTKKLSAVKSDIELLSSIASGALPIKTFEFDGTKYKKSDAPEMLKKVEAEKDELQNRIVKTEKSLFLFFIHKAKPDDQQTLLNCYKQYFKASEDLEKAIKNYTSVSDLITPFYHGSVPAWKAREIINSTHKIEKDIKPHIMEVFKEAFEMKYLEENELDRLQNYFSQDRDYMDNEGLNNIELDSLNEGLTYYINMMHRRHFSILKDLLDKQLEILECGKLTPNPHN